MGKKRKLNRFISRWIKSDLPEDRSTVLLLGVTRIPTSPKPTRRPCSLPAVAAPPFGQPVPRRNSGPSRRGNAASRSSTLRQGRAEASGSEKSPPPPRLVAPCQAAGDTFGGGSSDVVADAACASDTVTSSACVPHGCASVPVMDRSVDSIGTCSLDMEASVELADWSEGSSVGTLRSASLPTPSPEPRLPSYLSLACTVNGYSTTTNYDPERLARSRDTSPHRPNEYAQDRLTYAIRNNLLSPPNLVPLPPTRKHNTASDAQQHSLDMAEHTITHHHRQELYTSSSTTMTRLNTERIITTNLYTDAVDSCIENAFRSSFTNCANFDSKHVAVPASNGQAKTVAEKSAQEFSNGVESKSFIQQRVERLYGPGALAQGFFVMKRQSKNKSFYEQSNSTVAKANNDKHSKSMDDELLDGESSEGGMKQSTSNPTLPVLRHLRPEFRAQLPILTSKKGATETFMPKSITVPKIAAQAKMNGHGTSPTKAVVNGSASMNGGPCINGSKHASVKVGTSADADYVVKDGHYFLEILDKEAQRLLDLAVIAEQELQTPNLPEEAKGYLRSASGKANLFVSQKMQQFKGLCTNNIRQVDGEAFPTTNEDLQGFWDMIMLQVNQIDSLFKELDTLRENNWQEKEHVALTVNGSAKPKKVMKSIRPMSASAQESRKVREAQRKKLMEEKRKAMREQHNKQPKQSIEIFAPETPSS